MGPLQLRLDDAAGDGLGSLFHHPGYFRLHTPQGGLYARVCDEAGEMQACIHFAPVDGTHWRSPARGTYAAYAWRGAPPAFGEWMPLHAAIEVQLSERGARSLEILLPPMAHAPAMLAGQAWMLGSLGYAVSQWDLNYTLQVDARAFEERVSRGNAKRLRKCRREGFAARRLAADALPQVHALLADNRSANGHVLSMTQAQLADMMALFPNRVLLFGCSPGGSEELAAAAVCMRVAPHVLYVLYWGDRAGFESFSPVVPLAESIYSHCRDEGIALMDLGTSTEGAKPNDGLIHFKEGLGCDTSLKLRMTKELARA